jgi:hypothetical protein
MNSSDGSQFHAWANTVAAVLALVTATASAYFSWQSNKLHEEAVEISLRPRSQCNMVYDFTKEVNTPYVEVCWDLLISNHSESKVVVTELSVSDDDGAIWMTEDGKVHVLPLGRIYTTEGERITKLMTLEGGSAEIVVARQPTHVSDKALANIRAINQSDKGTIGQLDLLESIVLLGFFKKGPCGYLDDLDDQTGNCRVHYTIRARTSRGTEIVLRTGMPGPESSRNH